MKVKEILIIKPVLGDILGYPLLTGVYLCENKVEEIKFTKTDTFFHQLPYLNRKFLEKGRAFITNIKGIKYVEEWYRLFFNWKLPDYYRGRIENLLIGDYPFTYNCIKLRNKISQLEERKKQRLQVKLEKFLFPPIRESLLKEIPDAWEDFESLRELKEEDIFPEEVIEELKRLESYFKENEDIVSGSLYLLEEEKKEEIESEIPIEKENTKKGRTIGDLWENLSVLLLEFYLKLIKEFPQVEERIPYRKILDKSAKPFILGENFRKEIRQVSSTFLNLEGEVIKEFLYYGLKLTRYEFLKEEKECLYTNTKIWKVLRQWIEVGRIKPLVEIKEEELKNKLRKIWFNYKIEKATEREVYLTLTRIFTEYLLGNLNKKQRLFFNKWEKMNKEIMTDELKMRLLSHPLEVSRGIVYFIKKEQSNPYIRSFLDAWKSLLPFDLLMLEIGDIEYKVIREMRCKALKFDLRKAEDNFFGEYLNYIAKEIENEKIKDFTKIIKNTLPQGLDAYRLLLKLFS
jgi:hypothetical protein